MYSRRKFIFSCILSPSLLGNRDYPIDKIVSVGGEINSSDLGTTLIHEHVLVDFIGADKIHPKRWNHDQVIDKVLPYLLEAKQRGIQSIVECTPAYLGRDVLLLQKLSSLSNLTILTNTGYYGASENNYLPAFAVNEPAGQLAERWIKEFHDGIDNTGIKPGFIKIGVNPTTLSALHQKLIKAAALTHLETGLTICSHTGPPIPAFEQINILKNEGVSAEAFVWVHANSDNKNDFVKAAKMGAWVSLDGINPKNLDESAAVIAFMKSENLLHKILISHDAGWYKPGEKNGGEFTNFNTIPDQFVPLLKTKGFSDMDINQLMVKNPANVFTIKKRLL